MNFAILYYSRKPRTIIVKYNKIIARGIRTPEQILEGNKIKERRKVVEELKVAPKEELGAGDGLHFGQGDF